MIRSFVRSFSRSLVRWLVHRFVRFFDAFIGASDDSFAQACFRCYWEALTLYEGQNDIATIKFIREKIPPQADHSANQQVDIFPIDTSLSVSE